MKYFTLCKCAAVAILIALLWQSPAQAMDDPLYNDVMQTVRKAESGLMALSAYYANNNPNQQTILLVTPNGVKAYVNLQYRGAFPFNGTVGGQPISALRSDDVTAAYSSYLGHLLRNSAARLNRTNVQIIVREF